MKKIVTALLLCVALIACSDNDKKIQQCIDEISELTSTVKFCPEPVGPDGITVTINGVKKHYSQQESMNKSVDDCAGPVKHAIVVKKLGVLPQNTALKISKNWNYDDMKNYTNDDNMIQDYERDACDVLERLNKFITQDYAKNQICM